MTDFSERLKPERLTEEGKVSFFGYYDISPENKDGSKVVYNVSPFGDHMPGRDDQLSVYCLDIESRHRFLVDSTTAWNFQEGCRAQWMDENSLIYNVRTSTGYGARIFDFTKGDLVGEYEFPVYHVSNGLAVTYNFNRNRYSYAHGPGDEETDYDVDGIFLCRLADGKKKLLLSLSELSADAGTQDFTNWVEHCNFSPKGNRIVFFHRWMNDREQMHTRFCVSDLRGNYKVLLDNGFCSHAGWKNDEIVTAWGRLPGGMNGLQKNRLLQRTGIYKGLVDVYHRIVKNDALRQKMTNDAYINFDIRTGKREKIENQYFIADGHCSWSEDGRWMLTDTYPDSENYRHLVLYNESRDEISELGKFFSYPDIRDEEKYGVAGIRCDLHPKWGSTQKYVYFDSTHEGCRGLYRINLADMP